MKAAVGGRGRGGLAVDPALDLGELVDEEDALTLASTGGLDDPGAVGAALVLLSEEAEVIRKGIGHGDKV